MANRVSANEIAKGNTPPVQSIPGDGESEKDDLPTPSSPELEITSSTTDVSMTNNSTILEKVTYTTANQSHQYNQDTPQTMESRDKAFDNNLASQNSGEIDNAPIPQTTVIVNPSPHNSPVSDNDTVTPSRLNAHKHKKN